MWAALALDFDSSTLIFDIKDAGVKCFATRFLNCSQTTSLSSDYVYFVVLLQSEAVEVMMEDFVDAGPDSD